MWLVCIISSKFALSPSLHPAFPFPLCHSTCMRGGGGRNIVQLAKVLHITQVSSALWDGHVPAGQLGKKSVRWRQLCSCAGVGVTSEGGIEREGRRKRVTAQVTLSPL